MDATGRRQPTVFVYNKHQPYSTKVQPELNTKLNRSHDVGLASLRRVSIIREFATMNTELET